jgi:hypothetical protein
MDVERKIVNSKSEILNIRVEFDPSNIDEEGIAAIVATVADMAVQYSDLKEKNKENARGT